VQPCDEDEEKDDQFFFVFPSNGAPVEWHWQGKTEVLGGGGGDLSQCHFVHQNPTCDLGSNPGLRGGRSATNRLSHGTATCTAYYRTRRLLRGLQEPTDWILSCVTEILSTPLYFTY
jgi:hypothetical protein